MARRGRPPHPDILTPREWDVLALLRDGRTNDEIAARLGVSLSTAKFHVSEILGKLGLSSRDEAARWQPEHVPGRGLLLAPFAALRRAHLGWPLQLAGGVMILAVAASIGALIWGVGTTHDSRPTAPAVAAATATTATPCPDTIDPETPTLVVGVIDAAAAACTVVPATQGVTLAQWVRDGQTFVAYDDSVPAYRIYDLTGHVLDTINFKVPVPFDHHLYAWVAPSPDGNTILITRNAGSGVYSLNARDVATGAEHTFPALLGTNDTVSYSPDGTHVSYLNHNGDAEALVIARSDGSDAKTLRKVQNSREYVSPLQWSPDGSRLLIVDGALEVVDLHGATVWKESAAMANAGRVTSAQWAGSGRLLIQQPSVSDGKGGMLAPQAWFVSIPGGFESPADPRLAEVSAISPDGRLASLACSLIDISRLATIPTRGCALVYDWTRDSKLGLYSFGGK